MTTLATTPLEPHLLDDYLQRQPEADALVSSMRGLLATGAPFSRNQFEPGHFTASAFVLSPERTDLLLIFHAKLRRWLQPGGHVESQDASLERAARREVLEETGVGELSPFVPGIFDLDIHDIPARSTEAAHQHFDVRFAYVAGSRELRTSDEVGGARWVPLDDVVGFNSEESIIRPVAQIHRHRS